MFMMIGLDYLVAFGLLLLIVFLVSEFSHKINVVAVPLLIISGMIIGPYGLGIVEKFEGLEFFAELGFLFLVFLAGLEIRGVKNVKWKSVMELAIILASVSFFIGFGIVYFFGYRPPSYLLATPLLIGTVFQSSSVGEIIPIINHTPKLKDKIGNVLVPTVVLLDTISLIGLSLILHWYKNPNFYNFVFFLIFLAVFIFLGAKYIPKLGKWVFNRYKSSYEEMEIVFFMAVLFTMIGISELIGLEPIVAAFLTGLFLGESIEGEEICKKLSSIGKGFLIPIFFIVVGMDADVGVFMESVNYIYLVISIVLGLMISKVVGGYIYSKIFHRDLSLIGIVFFPQLGATLVATKIGQDYGLIDEPLFTSIVVMAIVTALSTPFIVTKVFGKVERSGKEGHAIVLGGGIIGEYAASALSLLHQDFVIVEKNKKRCDYLKSKGYDCILGDATKKEVLDAINVDDAKYALVLLSSSRDSVIASRYIRKRNPNCKIIARVHDEKERQILEDIADEVLYPEMIAGMNIIWHIMKLVEEDRER
jgi:Kef-type K+ transport system membrane component KefB